MILKQVTPRVRVWAPQDGDDVVLADEVLTAAVTGDPICWVNTILRLVEVERPTLQSGPNGYKKLSPDLECNSIHCGKYHKRVMALWTCGKGKDQD